MAIVGEPILPSPIVMVKDPNWHIIEIYLDHHAWIGIPVVTKCCIKYRQGRRNDVKARGADFRERALLNWYFLRDVCKTSGVELRLIMFSIYWMIGVWGGSPPGDCAILEARWLHSCVFWSKFVKELHWQFANCTDSFWQFAISPRQSFKLKGHLCPPCPSW
jgi:hypothetical protein